MNPDLRQIYFDGRHYDRQNEHFIHDIPFYLKQIKKFGDPVLELACGTGRIGVPLAEQGCRVTGIDLSDSMLALARAKALARNRPISLIKADIRNFSLETEFKVILLPFNSLAHLLDLESIASCFQAVRRHLAADGRFIIDYFNPNLRILTRASTQQHFVASYPDPEGGGQTIVTETNTYDAATQINHIVWHYQIGDQHDVFVAPLDMRMFYPQELAALLHYNGFAIESCFGDYAETPFQSTSTKQLIVSMAWPA